MATIYPVVCHSECQRRILPANGQDPSLRSGWQIRAKLEAPGLS